MSTLSLFSPSPSPLTISPEYPISGGIFRPNVTLRSQKPHFKTSRIHNNSSSNGQPKNNDSSSSSRFLDEDGVVEDMDGYLNHLSLEYDSVWDTKPYW